MKKFISIPNNFKGVGEATEHLIFPAIIDRHAEGFITCYTKADLLFKRLDKVQEKFKVCWNVSKLLTLCCRPKVNQMELNLNQINAESL